MEKRKVAFDGVILHSKIAEGDPVDFETLHPAQRLRTSYVEKVMALGKDALNGVFVIVQTRNTIYTLTHVEWPA